MPPSFLVQPRLYCHLYCLFFSWEGAGLVLGRPVKPRGGLRRLHVIFRRSRPTPKRSGVGLQRLYFVVFSGKTKHIHYCVYGSECASERASERASNGTKITGSAGETLARGVKREEETVRCPVLLAMRSTLTNRQEQGEGRGERERATEQRGDAHADFARVCAPRRHKPQLR